MEYENIQNKENNNQAEMWNLEPITTPGNGSSPNKRSGTGMKLFIIVAVIITALIALHIIKFGMKQFNLSR